VSVSTAVSRSLTVATEATHPGPSRRITVEPIRTPAKAPAKPDRPGPELPRPEACPLRDRRQHPGGTDGSPRPPPRRGRPPRRTDPPIAASASATTGRALVSRLE
jgi:hypothetical protein